MMRRAAADRPARQHREQHGQVQDGEGGGCLAGVGRRREDQARHPKRGGSRHIGRAEEPVHADVPVPKPPHELERSDQQGEHAAEHMHAEGELVLEVGLPLLGEVDLGVKREVPRHDDDDVDAGQGHDHPARSGQPAGEAPVRQWTVRSGGVPDALGSAHGVLARLS